MEAVHGLIPTYAGNTICCGLSSSGLRAHPHVCGEHASILEEPTLWWGSSPRMRGTRTHVPRRTQLPGLIPTYAGNTAPAWRLIALRRAHPHVCGEHGTATEYSSPTKGSSPRMRGTQYFGVAGSVDLGLIPTYAGNTHLFQ